MRLYYRDTYIIHLLELCYTETMMAKRTSNQSVWVDWALSLREGLAPLAVVGSQILLAGKPLLGLFWPQDRLDALILALEEGEMVPSTEENT